MKNCRSYILRSVGTGPAYGVVMSDLTNFSAKSLSGGRLRFSVSAKQLEALRQFLSSLPGAVLRDMGAERVLYVWSVDAGAFQAFCHRRKELGFSVPTVPVVGSSFASASAAAAHFGVTCPALHAALRKSQAEHGERRYAGVTFYNAEQMDKVIG